VGQLFDGGFESDFAVVSHQASASDFWGRASGWLAATAVRP
jgi:rhamnogalacturonyl hydrolase YesR